MTPGKWSVDEIKGLKNAAVPHRIMRAAVAVAQALEDAYALLPRVRKEMGDTRTQHSKIDQKELRAIFNIDDDIEFETAF
jgi:hypothetical protein